MNWHQVSRWTLQKVQSLLRLHGLTSSVRLRLVLDLADYTYIDNLWWEDSCQRQDSEVTGMHPEPLLVWPCWSCLEMNGMRLLIFQKRNQADCIQQKHIWLFATAEHVYYNEEIKQCPEAYQPEQCPSEMHYSREYAQQLYVTTKPQHQDHLNSSLPWNVNCSRYLASQLEDRWITSSMRVREEESELMPLSAIFTITFIQVHGLCQ